MTRNSLAALAVLFAVLAVLAANTFFVVSQTEQAIVLRFGQPVRVINAAGQDDPGLKLKAPFIENSILFDKRNQSLDVDRDELIAADQQRLTVDAFLRYRIVDPLKYLTALHDEDTAHARLDPLVSSSLRQVLGTATSTDIISARRDQLMVQTRNEVAQEAATENLGIQVIDLRIKRADLPTANAEAVYKRMQTNYQQQAAKIRAIGEQQKRSIMAEADKEVTVTLAEAQQTAETTRGEGDAKRAVIFAQSFGRDPKFAAFYRSMAAYEASLGQGDTTMVLAPDSEFFKYFKNGPGK